MEHVREYFAEHPDHSIDEIRRVRVEFEADRMMVYLYDDEDVIDQFPLDISREQAVNQFGVHQEENLYFLSGMSEGTLLSTVEDQLKNRSMPTEELLDLFRAYGNKELNNYPRQECMRLGLKYRFHDVLH